MRVLRRLRLLPLLILVALLSFAVRIGDVVTGVSDLSGSAFAKGGEEHAVAPPPAEAATVAPVSKSSPPPEASRAAATGEEPKNYEKIEWQDATDTETEYSGVSMELFEDLSARRKQLEERERQIYAREALLKAAEQELDQKFRELQILRGELEALLKKQSEEEEARIQSLVKIYEGMKSGDAARIFNTLDIDVLVEVMGRMSERKLSPILADMNPDRARAVTIILAQQKQLPELPR